MTIDLSNPDTDFVSLLEIEIGHRIDLDAWAVALIGPPISFYLADEDNHRIKKHKCSDLSYISKAGTLGNGDSQFNSPQDICQDETHLYITDFGNDRIIKRKISDLSYVAQIGTSGAGDEQFNGPTGICTDGTYLYICDSLNSRIKKHKCSDLSYVAQIGTVGVGDDQFNSPKGICTDGTHVYICDDGNNRLKKHLCSDLSYVAKIGSVGGGDEQFNGIWGICTDNTILYITEFGNARIKKHLCADLSYVAKESGTPPNSLTHPAGITTDETHIYIAELNEVVIQKRLCADLSFDSKALSWGAGDNQITDVWGMGYGEVGPSNTYYISHSEGMPTKVEQCLRSTLVITTYTERATLALCNDNPSSWYWDSANNRLYIHTSGSDDPGTAGKYLIQSYFWDCFCNKQAGDIVFETIAGIPHFYLPYLDNTIPPIRMATSGYHEGGTRQTFGTISVINADGYFDARLSDYIYEAKKMRYKVGKRGDIYTDYIIFWLGWTGNIGWSDEYITVGIDDLRKCREY